MCKCDEECSFNEISKDILYEIHITVKDADVEKFKEVCNKINVKPILLDLQKEGLYDLMTSSVVKSDSYCLAITEATIIREQLINNVFDVIRSKIETVPWNPIISQYTKGYYETHLAVKCHDSMFQALREIAKIGAAHVSKNVFKKVDDIPVYMITYRTYSRNIKLHENYVNILKKAFGEFDIVKTIFEFCIFDSNLEHDNKWMNNSTI